MPLSTRKRASRFLFQLEASDGLDYQGRLVARTGQIGTFTAGGTAGTRTAVDRNGRVYVESASKPRYHHQYDAASGLFVPAGFLFEGQRKNLVIQPEALTVANGWTNGGAGTLGITPNYSTCGIVSLTQITGNLATNYLYRVVTLTGDGVKCISQIVQFDGTTGKVACCGLYDATAAAYRAYAVVTWAADGTATCAVVGVGASILKFSRLAAGTYRVELQTGSCTAANTHWCVSIVNAGAAAIGVRAGAAQVEDALFPSRYIPQTTSVLTRSADVPTFPIGFPPGAMTVYLKFVDIGNSASPSAGSGGLFEIGYSGNTRLQIYFNGSGTLRADLSTAAGGSAGGTGAITFGVGDTVEVRCTVTAAGVCTLATSKNSGSEFVGPPGAAAALDAAFGTPIIRFGDLNGGQTGFAALQAARVAAAVQSLAYMQAA
jgi:hypothetical protein